MGINKVEPKVTPILNNPIIQVISPSVEARLLYSAYADLLKIMDCFFDFHDNKKLSYLTKYPVTGLLVLTHDLQSASQNPYKETIDYAAGRIPVLVIASHISPP